MIHLLPLALKLLKTKAVVAGAAGAAAGAVVVSSYDNSSNYRSVQLRCRCGNYQNETVRNGDSFDYRTTCSQCGHATLALA